MTAPTNSYAYTVAELLVRQRALLPERATELYHALKDVADEDFDAFVVKEGFVTKEDLLKALSAYYNVPSFDARGYFFNHMYVRMFPKDAMLRNRFIPLDVDDEIMVVVASNPTDSALAELINTYVSYELTFLVGLEDDISDAVEEYYDEALTVDPEIVDDAQDHEEQVEHEAQDILEGVRLYDNES